MDVTGTDDSIGESSDKVKSLVHNSMH